MHSLITRHTLSRMAQARSQRLGEQLYPLYYPEFFHKTVPAGTTSWEEPVAAGGEQFCECARAQALSHTHISSTAAQHITHFYISLTTGTSCRGSATSSPTRHARASTLPLTLTPRIPSVYILT